MTSKAKTMVLASFAADSLALGVHWIYDAARIASEYGRVESFLKPKENSYHSTKDMGEFTHYGDQQVVLLESLAAKKSFDLNDFSERWQNLFRNYKGYFDGPPKTLCGIFRRASAHKIPVHPPMIWPGPLESPQWYSAIRTMWMGWLRRHGRRPK